MAFSPKKFLLCFNAKLWHCTNLQLENGFDHFMHVYHIKLKCNNCEETKEVEMRHCNSPSINPYLVEVQNRPKDEVILPEDSRANYLGLCSTCSSLLWVKMVLGHGEAYAPKDVFSMICEEESYGKMMVFEVYGGSPCDYTCGGRWQVEKENGETIEGIDLSSGFWAEESEDHHETAAGEESEEIEASDGAANDENEEYDSGSSSSSSGSEIVQGACIFSFSVFYKSWEA